MDTLTEAGPSSSSNSPNRMSHNVDRATAEFNSVVAAHKNLPNAVSIARAFSRVRVRHLSVSYPP